jgi:hypothetical protein
VEQSSQPPDLANRSREDSEETTMQHQKELPPFEQGDRLKYLGDSSIKAADGSLSDTLLKSDMIGTVVYSKPAWTDSVSGKTKSAHCVIRFENGYEYSINSRNKDRFEKLR